MELLSGIDFHDHWWWMILAVLLGIGEIIIPGVFLIWVAIAAALTGGIAMATGIGLASQIVLFAVLCLVATWAGRRWYAGNPVDSQDPMLNDRVARLIGETVIVVEPITAGQGRVKIGDSVWNARGPDAAAGVWVRIVGADGATVKVELA
ncbi:MAG: NfeD family protein [Sphingobium phenoxybenzoativorans]|uniref:NfeD family protein n=2 Tax=Sphingobium phenoxybenzoativorans TaxID=1592790 RepID=A0A975KA68_9SPHN|nr:NfeD family protein [Sphingobium phenoxybenzoativorans]QUT07322.1 NfeD family protein [Sphingobium phenoxybenzoativorans]